MTGHYAQAILAHPLAGEAAALEREAVRVANTLKRDFEAGALHPLSITTESDDLAPARAVAAKLRDEAEHVVVLGIGGSSLGAQAIAQLTGLGTPVGVFPRNGPRLHFPENPDAQTMEDLLAALPLAHTRFVLVSKSGGTAEPMMQALLVIARLKREGLGAHIGELFTVVTEPTDNPLGRLAAEYGMARLEHPTDIGGRFSVFSVVGLLPALVMGLDAMAVRQGAISVWQNMASAAEGSAPVLGAAFSVAGAKSGRPVQVLMPYADRLERLAFWYRQLWAESLGKGGQGTLPVRALGPIDQHSQLQLYLDGPDSAIFSVLTVDFSRMGETVPADASADPALQYLVGKRLGELVLAEARATLDTLVAAGRPARSIALNQLDEESLGGLFMHFMIETILYARMLDIEPFGQPAVETGKVLARKYLAGGGG